MSLDGGQGMTYDHIRIFFEDLSQDAQDKALTFKGIKSPSEANWDIFEMAAVAEGTKYDLSQDEIDDAALCTIGFYSQCA